MRLLAIARVLPLGLMLLAAACPRASDPDGGAATDAAVTGCAAGCAQGERCVRDQCLAVACGATPCAADEVCEAGACVGLACAGLACPGDSRCLRGRCYAAGCGATPCGAGSVCEGARCVEAACAGITCAEGSACRGGVCDQCLPGFVPLDGGCGRLRPPGQACGEAAECETGVCARGVCCLTPCLGQCEGCDATGQCRSLARGAPGSPACFPGRCGGDRLSCVEDCLTDGDCAAGALCDRSGPTPRCLPKYVDGTACTASTECSSGFCVAGRCCDTACQGQCATCNGLTSDGFPSGTPLGTCSPAPAGANPRVGDACGTFLCDGLIQDCAVTCGTDRACRADLWCGGAAVFTCSNPLLGSGATCDRDRQCLTGRCVDGFCCDTACAGECMACNVSGREGRCSGETGPRTLDGGYCSEGTTCSRACDGVCQTCSSSACEERTDNGRGAACGNFGCGGGYDAGCRTSCVPGTTDGCARGLFCEAGQPPRCVLQRGGGATCATDAGCVAGPCCNALCAEVNDPSNCGGCGMQCDPSRGGYACEEDRCCERCDGTTCIDVSNDPANCGGCSQPCATQDGSRCLAGTCCETCGTGGCVDLTADSQHCGSCEVTCTGACVNSACE